MQFHVVMQFLRVDMQKIYVNMRFFSEHACSEKNRMLTLTSLTYMFRFQVHVDTSSCMWTYKQ